MPTVASAYLETQVVTASPERLHLMVVDGALRFARLAEQRLAEQDREGAFLALCRSRDCVNEILVGISDEPNPDLAERMRGLFAYVQTGLARADLAQDPQLVRESIILLEAHRRTWLELIGRLQPRGADAPSSDGTAQTGRSWTT